MTEQPLSATLFRVLILAAGMEANPGPLCGLAKAVDSSPAFTCPSCSVPPPVSTPPARPVLKPNHLVSDIASPPDLEILQFNANGLLGKLDKLLVFMRSHSIAEAVPIAGTSRSLSLWSKWARTST
ncbi:unnamed protein product [Dibothriocephalus latus]|uniref:Uncharacterized protein n=1 Tax=Dibothriocephalus latus TaxID=60516 RepID=A0A3P7RI54_DIBLA|nr:unnamed protein product [Dibothriocephalus latus]